MKIIERILLPTDFTMSSRDAMEMAITLAKNFDAEIILLHVLPVITKSQLVSDMLNNTTRDQIKAIRKEISLNGVKTAEPVFATGNHSDHIIQLAESRDVNLIIIGSGEKENDERFKLSPTAKKVIRKTNKPVWVVKRGMSSHLRRIICPIDFSKLSHRTLKNAIHLAREFKAELTVLTVIDAFTYKPLGINAKLTQKQKLIANVQTDKFDHFLKEFDFHDVKLSKAIFQGKPYKEILKSIKIHKYDLLVIGTEGRAGFSKMLKDSITEKVIREVPCSFITVKAKDFIRLKLETKIHNLETYFKESKQLFAKGFAKEALKQFQLCLNIDRLYIPAWEGMASVHERLGQKEKAQNCRMRARDIRDQLWNRKIEAEIRSRSWMVNKM